MKWLFHTQTLGDIAATLIVLMVVGLVLSGVAIVESNHVNFGACGARGSICLVPVPSEFQQRAAIEPSAMCCATFRSMGEARLPLVHRV